MLQVIRSNRVESLFDVLAHRLAAAPLASPLAPEIVVAPSPAMARWVNLQLARHHGVAANLQYPLPSSFVWQLARERLAELPEEDPLAIEQLAWQVFGALPGLLEVPEFAPLRGYLADDGQALKRWQLAGRIADLFDRYQLHRPERIRAWDAGEGADWQAVLWRRLVVDIEGAHRVAVIDRLLAALAAPSREGQGDRLPERISLFAISSLPPLLIEVFQALAAHTAVDLYLHAPTEAFWADLVSQKVLARKRLEHPDEADLWEVGNPLLASWGRQGQALHDLLLSRDTPLVEVDAFTEPATDTLLGRLQHDIFRLRPIAAAGERQAVEPDDSLQVHVTHSPLRECQVLHDRLLAMLDADQNLRPEDILVMIPEISAYAPYVEAVFDQDGERGRPFIPWNLSDISVADEHPLVEVFLGLLDLPASRFGQSEVLSYLDVPELAGHFGLDGEAVAQIRDWLAQARLRWGLDAEHKARLGLPGAEENTWAQAERRLFAGYAMGDAMGEVDLFDGIAPIGGVEGTGAEVLGRFWRLFGALTEAAARLAVPRTAGQWQDCLGGLLVELFGERDDEDGRLQKVRDALGELAEQAAGLAEPLSPALVRRWLAARLGAAGRRGRYFSGGVTFCGMRPMRSLPFAVICVLGLDDLAFPRRDRPVELDVAPEGWRPGDPRKGDEDRYLFLETLLCARRRLYLSHVGRDIRRNTERQPSVLLRELLDYIDQQYRPADGADDRPLSARLTTVHPLQPFSPRSYVAGTGSYDDYWCEVARAIQAPNLPDTVSTNWCEHRLSEAPERMREVTLEQLERFLRHPIRYFVASRLQIHMAEEAPAEDAEPFAFDALERYLLKERLVADRLRGRTPSRQRLGAEGALPHGAFADLVLGEQDEQVVPLVERLAPYRERRPEPVAIDFAFDADDGPRRLTGQVADIYPGLGLLRWRPGTMRGADLLGLWLAHLAWCAAGGPGERRSALHTLGEGVAIEAALPPAEARAALARYLDWYWEGLHRPLLALPRASWAFALARHRGGRGDPLNAARSAWLGSDYQGIPGDRHDPHVALVLRGVAGEPLDHPEFQRLAEAFYDEPLAHGAPP
ncbi:exodeoxyribonuclease V, gamma subunit [Thioflavicoccus mobilis 8321]|uniref:RecBCD enzyme subunit RecC n=1 Tax=Thioflavicoccus mobilis 8321 TaxID=765912 RepID=L0GYZ6_9GAMM|nr:exodeoxyribonuclease V subunit gamma [Thioflavicoccus mobilis]AGA91057.1 exodeoxyribonuclease V, gamma subunit [Thioflavicoccus mobilis 8321]